MKCTCLQSLGDCAVALLHNSTHGFLMVFTLGKKRAPRLPPPPKTN